MSERRAAKLLDDCRNYGLPKNLAVPPNEVDGPPPGLRSGWLISQYSAASMLNALKTRCMPYSVDSIPTGNNSEDYVSMASNATKATYDSLDLAYAIVAIELLVACRALLMREAALGGSIAELMSPATRGILQSITQRFDLGLNADRELAPLIQETVALMKSGVSLA